jgi:hypothetical protein
MISIRVMKNISIAVITVAAIAAALLIAATVPSILANDGFAKRQRASFHETASQSCVNQNARCQNLLGQTQGHDNAGTVVGNQPSS